MNRAVAVVRGGRISVEGRRQSGLLVAVLALVAMVAGATPASSDTRTLPNASWEVVGEIPKPSFSAVAVPLSGGRALLTGSGETNNEVLLFDPARGIVRVADAPSPLSMHIGASLDGGRRVLVCGGGSADFFTLTNRCFVYDPAPNSWSEVASLPSPTFFLYSNPAATLPDGRVIVTGGSTPDDRYGTAFVSGYGEFGLYVASRNTLLFDPAGHTVLANGRVLAGAWSSGAPMPTTRIFGTHAPGFTGGAIALDRPRATGRVGHAVVVLPHGRVVVVGGRHYNPGFFYGMEPIDIYDPKSDVWARAAALPPIPQDGDGGYGGRGFAGVTLLGSGEVLVFGGTATHLEEALSASGRATFRLGGSAAPRTSSVMFDPITGHVRRVGNLNVGRAFSLAAALPAGGGAFAIGGRSVLRDPPQGELYDPVGGTWSLLPAEPLQTFDGGPRLGAGLTDGAVLTWSVDEQNPGPATVKRLRSGP